MMISLPEFFVAKKRLIFIEKNVKNAIKTMTLPISGYFTDNIGQRIPPVALQMIPVVSLKRYHS